MDVVKCADWVIDMGIEGGENGGNVIAKGTPEDVAKSKVSVTAKYLKEKLVSK
jgi:excinuclease ABC subunit A